MSKLMVIVPALLAAGCVSQRGEVASVAAEATATAPLAIAAPTAVEDEATAAALPEGTTVQVHEATEFESVLICNDTPRSGSRIRSSTCYSREAYAAIMEAKRADAQRYLNDLEREQRMLAIQQQEAAERQRQQMAR